MNRAFRITALALAWFGSVLHGDVTATTPVVVPPGSTYVCAPDQPAPTAEQQRQQPDLVWLPAAAERPPASTSAGYALALSGG